MGSPSREPGRDRVAALSRWIENTLGGRVTAVERQPRWRPVWFVDLERDGERLPLCVRGSRVDGTLPWPHRQEMAVLAGLEAAGLPVPHVYGWIDEELGFVTDRISGEPPELGACSEAERREVLDDYLRMMARMHRLDVAPFAAAGVTRAAVPADSGRIAMQRYEVAYRAAKCRPDPFAEFVLGWLRRNPLDNHGREALIAWDSGQFHHRDGRLTGLLDLEMGHVGDPLMDLAGLAGREAFLHYGDLADLCRRYQELGGYPVDMDAVEYYAIAFLMTVQLMFHRPLARPTALSDYTVNLTWCALTNLWVCELLCQRLGLPLPERPPAPPVAEVDAFRSAPVAQLLASLEDAAENATGHARYRAQADHRLALHLQWVHELGEAIGAGDLDDLAPLLGRRPASWNAGEAELERFVLADGGEHDAELIALFYRRHCRQQQLLGPPESRTSALRPVTPIRVPGR